MRRGRLQLVRPAAALPAPQRPADPAPSSVANDRRWPPLSEPVDPIETQLRSRAQSMLSGPLLGQCPPLTLAQARDVIAWYCPRTT